MDYTRDQISQEVANSWTSLTENTKQIDVAEEACKIAEENLDLNTFSYKEENFRSSMFFPPSFPGFSPIAA